MKKKLETYQGKLTSSQIADGMNAAAANAQRLLADATTLFEARRFPTAVSLAVLSIEEAGKISILRSLALVSTNTEASEVWREYRSHVRKNVLWLFPQLVADGARKLDDFKELFEKESEHPYTLDQVKQLGFYTDCLGNAHWSSPDAVIDEGLARMLVNVAKILVQKSHYTEEEIQLWREHIGPVWKREPNRMKEALVAWYAAMQQKGLAPKGSNEMEQFVVSQQRNDLLQ